MLLLPYDSLSLHFAFIILFGYHDPFVKDCKGIMWVSMSSYFSELYLFPFVNIYWKRTFNQKEIPFRVTSNLVSLIYSCVNINVRCSGIKMVYKNIVYEFLPVVRCSYDQFRNVSFP